MYTIVKNGLQNNLAEIYSRIFYRLCKMYQAVRYQG